MPKLKGNRMGGNHLAVVPGDRCIGCAETKGHRPDCTVKPGRLRCTEPGCTATRAPGVKVPVWGVRGHSRGYLCPEHFT